MEDINNPKEDNCDQSDGGERIERLSSSMDGLHFARSPPNSSYFNLSTKDRTSSHHQRYSHYRRRNSGSSQKNVTLSPQNPPDSPQLGPTSLGSSPTRLNLSTSSPPTQKPMTLTLSTVASVATGCTSPLLEPVATPSEDAPMTPMVLDS